MIRFISFLVFIIYTSFLYSQNSELAYNKIDPSLTRNAYSIIRYDDLVLEFNAHDKIKYTHSYAVTAKNIKGADHLVFQAYYKENTAKVKDIKIHILDGKGKLILEVDDDEIEDFISYDGVSMVVDSRVKTYSYTPTEYPVTMQVKYSYETKTTLFVPSFYPVSRDRQAVESSTYRIHNKSGTEIQVRIQEKEGITINRTEDFYFASTDIKPIIMEPYMPPFDQVISKVEFNPVQFKFEDNFSGFYKDWNSLALWYYQNFIQNNVKWESEEVKREFYDIISPDQNIYSIIDQVYEYLQKNTRYISITLEEGGLMPLSADEVHKNKYGDCKALSLYMQSILDIYNIPSHYAIVEAESKYPVDLHQDFASVAQGNHIIVCIPIDKDTLWVDCTSPNNPVGFLGAFTDNRKVLLINKDGGSIVTTPSYDKYNQCNTISHIKLLNDHLIKADIKIENLGIAMQTKIAIPEYADDDRLEYFKNISPKHIKGLKIKQYKNQYLNKNWNVQEKIVLEAEDFVEIAGDYLLIPIHYIKFDIPYLKKDKNRRHSIYFPREKQLSEKLIVDIPKGYKLYDIPDSVSITSEYGEYYLTIKQIANQIIVSRKFIQKKGTFPPEQFKKIRNYFKAIRNTNKAQITLRKV